jgi:hypothetical protein
MLKALVVLLSLSCSIQSTADQHNTEHGKPEYVAGELVVMFREGVADSRMNAINDAINVQVVRKMPLARVHVVKVPQERSLEEVRQAYLSFPEVQAVEPNYKIRGM